MFIPHRWTLAILALVLPLLCSACGVYAPLQLTPVKTATPIAPRFTQSYYYYDRDKDLYFVLRSHSTDAASGKPVDQIATVHVFWHPHGGVTTLNSSALNATIRYLVMTPDAVGLYEGAGFVRLFSKLGAGKFNARIMDGDLRLAQASTSFVDTLGRARISGAFAARYDDAKAADMLLGAQREFFARSLLSKPPGATQPATIPATAPGATTSPATSPTTPASPEQFPGYNTEIHLTPMPERP